MNIAPAWPQCLAFLATPLVIEPSPSKLSGDAGLLPIRQFDQYIGLTQAFAEALDNPPATRTFPSTPSRRWAALTAMTGRAPKLV